MLYSNSAFGPPLKNVKRLDVQTQPNYLFGGMDVHAQPWRFQVTQVALAADVATITGTLIGGGGPMPQSSPAVGAKMGVRATTTGGGTFNVDPAIVTAVNWNPSTSTIAVSFALTSGNVAATADVGEFVILPAETFDPVSAGSASQAAALIFTPDESNNSRGLFAEARWVGTVPSAAVVVLQVANVDDDSRYMTVTNSGGSNGANTVAEGPNLASIAAGAVTQNGATYTTVLGKFIRSKVLSMSGGDATTGLVVSIFV